MNPRFELTPISQKPEKEGWYVQRIEDKDYPQELVHYNEQFGWDHCSVPYTHYLRPIPDTPERTREEILRSVCFPNFPDARSTSSTFMTVEEAYKAMEIYASRFTGTQREGAFAEWASENDWCYIPEFMSWQNPQTQQWMSTAALLEEYLKEKK